MAVFDLIWYSLCREHYPVHSW